MSENNALASDGLSSSTEPQGVSAVPASIPDAVLRGLLSFPPDALKVLDALGDGEYVQSAAYVAADTGVPERRVKEVHRALRTLGLAHFGVLTREDDGLLCGAGYWVSTNGFYLREAIAQAMEARRAGTEGSGAKHDSAVPEGNAP